MKNKAIVEYLKVLKMQDSVILRILEEIEKPLDIKNVHTIVEYLISEKLNVRQIRMLLEENPNILSVELSYLKQVINIFKYSMYRFKMLEIIQIEPMILIYKPEQIKQNIITLEKWLIKNKAIEEIVNNRPEILLLENKMLENKLKVIQEIGLQKYMLDILLEEENIFSLSIQVEQLKEKYLN